MFSGSRRIPPAPPGFPEALAPATDIRDACTRSAETSSITYADGDEIRIGTTRYATVWVEPHDRDGVMAFRRVYLLRHEVTWPEV